jgi:hypothetical protein
MAAACGLEVALLDSGMRASVILTICLGLMISAARAESEKSYVQAWALAHKGKASVRLADGTRCDVVTATHAVEVVVAPRWQDAIGQALYHATQLNKHPGIVLIMNGPKDAIYRQRLDATVTIFNLPIEVWEVGAGAAKPKPQE